LWVRYPVPATGPPTHLAGRLVEHECRRVSPLPSSGDTACKPSSVSSVWPALRGFSRDCALLAAIAHLLASTAGGASNAGLLSAACIHACNRFAPTAEARRSRADAGTPFVWLGPPLLVGVHSSDSTCLQRGDKFFVADLLAHAIRRLSGTSDLVGDGAHEGIGGTCFSRYCAPRLAALDELANLLDHLIAGAFALPASRREFIGLRPGELDACPPPIRQPLLDCLRLPNLRVPSADRPVLRQPIDAVARVMLGSQACASTSTAW
jgi:hypothetical protein